MDRSEIHVGQVVFFTKEGIKRHGKCFSGVPLTVIDVEPESYKGSMDVYVRFAVPSYDMPFTLWIHSSHVCSGTRCSSNVAFFHNDEALNMFMSEF